MTNYIGYDEDQKIHAVGTDPEDVMRETGVEYVLPATVALFQAFHTGDVVWLTVDVDGVETACLEDETE